MQRVGARRWMARIIIAWGIVATSMAWIAGETSFYIMRLILARSLSPR
jgi:ACS family tartrate transporter-like MFS transporter